MASRADGAGQALGRRSRAEGADLLQARGQQRRAALDLRHGAGVDRGQGLGVEHADELAADAQRQADLGADARDRRQVVGRVADVLDDRGNSGADDAPDDPRRRREPVVDLPAPARRLQAQPPALGQEDRRQQATPGEVVDDRLARVARRAGALEVALELAARRGAAGSGGGRRGVLRPRFAGAAEQPALAVVDLHRAQRLELLGALDALGHDPRADLAGERGGGAQHGLARRVAVDAGDHVARELEEVGPDLGDVLQRREPGAGVVDRDERAAGDPRAQPLAQQRVVEHGVLLGELDHEPLRQSAGDLEQARVAERLRRKVDPQQAAVRRHAGGGDRRPARDLEVVAQARAARGGEHHVRRERRSGRAAWGSAPSPRSRSSRDRSGARSAGTRRGSRRVRAGRGSRQPLPWCSLRSARTPRT